VRKRNQCLCQNQQSTLFSKTPSQYRIQSYYRELISQTLDLLCMTADHGWVRLLQLVQMHMLVCTICSCRFHFHVIECGLKAGFFLTICWLNKQGSKGTHTLQPSKPSAAHLWQIQSRLQRQAATSFSKKTHAPCSALAWQCKEQQS